MQRETVNRIRYLLEEWLPPVLRDSGLMRVFFRAYWGAFIDDLEEFRKQITAISAADYRRIYERMPRIQEQTDNSRKCLEEIAARSLSGRICDVGCGTGHLLSFIGRSAHLRSCEFIGVDLLLDTEAVRARPNVSFVEAPIERLPFPDGYFTTVICTHVLEHVLDIQAAMAELRRVCSGRLIIVVPLEREYKFTFNPHIHFFPYPHSFLRYIIPVPIEHSMRVIGRDLLYAEERA